MSESTPTKMQYVRLGNSGLKVSRIILGCMSYGDPEWSGQWVLPEEEGIKHIKAAYDAGIQTFDTADTYSNGASEVVLGKALKQHQIPRESVVIMTKVFFGIGETSKSLGSQAPNRHGLSRKHIFESVKASLSRLQLDYVDVLQCHRFDEETPIAETMQALHDVVQAGYARYIGMSSCWAWQFHAMQNYAITNKLTPFISMQNHYCLIYREEEREMFPTLKMLGVGSIPWSALGRGILTRPFNKESKRSEADPYTAMYSKNPATPAIVNKVEELATQKGVSMAQIAMAWCLSKDGVSAPIVGTTSLKNLEDILGSLDVKLTEEEIKSLEEPYTPQSVLGHA